jgi:hypothetical protein
MYIMSVCPAGAVVCLLRGATWFQLHLGAADCAQQLMRTAVQQAASTVPSQVVHCNGVCARGLAEVVCVLHLLPACRSPHALR